MWGASDGPASDSIGYISMTWQDNVPDDASRVFLW